MIQGSRLCFLRSLCRFFPKTWTTSICKYAKNKHTQNVIQPLIWSQQTTSGEHVIFTFAACHAEGLAVCSRSCIHSLCQPWIGLHSEADLSPKIICIHTNVSISLWQHSYLYIINISHGLMYLLVNTMLIYLHYNKIVEISDRRLNCWDISITTQ